MRTSINPGQEIESVGVMMVATNDYIGRWFNTARDLEKYAFQGVKNVRIHLFTNRVTDAQNWGRKNLSRISLTVHEIKDWGWPEATLFRYEFFINADKSIEESILMYCDSDMEIRGDFQDLLQPLDWDAGMAFVQHPGYFRNKGAKGILDLLANPKLLGPSLRSVATRSKGLGSWENSKSSTAYLPPRMRRNYVHGAIWFGKRESFLSMCAVLSENIRKDLESGYVAIWHDESHLNWYFASIGGSILGNELSGVARFKHLRGVQSRILTVEKSIGEGRVPTEDSTNDN